MKKLLMLFAAAAMLFTACSKKAEGSAGAASTTAERLAAGDKLYVVASIFPEYDWARQIIGDSQNVKLDLLVKNGTDLHSYQPSTADIVKINSADLFIYVGGESDAWVSKVLSESSNSSQLVINLMEVLAENLKDEEVTEGMQAEEDAEEENAFDEHIWLSVKNARRACEKIAESLEILDLANADLYASNMAVYAGALDQLQAKEEELSKRFEGGKNTLIVCDRFPFRYMTEELGAKYFAAFPGCSAETEASFETVAFLSTKLAQLYPKAVLVTESSDEKLARTVIEGSGLKNTKIVKLNSMQSVTMAQIQDGTTYFEIFLDNLNKLESSLK